VSSARLRSSRALTPDAAAAEIVAAAFAVRPAPRILIDGRSGSGKTTLARMVAAQMPALQVVGLDEVYPGWDGLREGAERAFVDILRPHAEGRMGRWRRWDWAESRYAEEETVDPERPLLVEGAGLLTARSAAVGDVRVWVDAPAPERRRRALLRDGATYEPHWERWARQEDEHLAVNEPEARASLRVLADLPQPAADAARVSPSSR
jgi:uridine kinase